MKRLFPQAGWLALVAVVAVLERLALWLAYPPVTYDDSNSYRRLAEQILGAAPFDGTRSPGYPIFLAWLGPDLVVYAAQLILGLATTLLFFYLGWLVTGKEWVGVAAALIHTLNMGQLLFEATLLAETLTTFLMLLTLCGGVYFLKKGTFEFNPKELGLAFLTGLAGGLAAQVRPQFVFLPFLVAFFIFIEAARKSILVEDQNLNHEGAQSGTQKTSSSSFVLFMSFARPGVGWARVVKALKTLTPNKKLWVLVFSITIPALLINALWLNYIHTQFGVWSMSSVDGYHIVQHTGKFFEYVPDEHAAIRDTFLKYRAQQIARTGKPSNTIWAAVPELKEVSGLGFYKLSRKLQEISGQLIREHPLLYLVSVFESWAWFWSAPFYWTPQAFGAAAPLLDALAQVQRAVLWAANAAFIAGTFALAFGRVRKAFAMPASLWLMLAVVWTNSILQAIVQASENPRYSVSTQTLVLLVVAWWVWKVLRKERVA